MTATGWTNEPSEAPALPLTQLLMASRGENAATPLELALARGRADDRRAALEAATSAPDPDERAASFVARGYMPGMVSQLTQRLADTEAQLAEEEARIEATARRSQRTHEMHQRGQIDISGVIARMQDTEEGDPARLATLTRRRDSLRQQIAQAAELMAPPRERAVDAVESASRHAHDEFVAVTRARMAAAASGAPQRERRPFAGRGGVAVRSDQPVTCPDCITIGATPEQSYLIHADPDAPAGVRMPSAELTDADLAEFGRQVDVPYRPGAA